MNDELRGRTILVVDDEESFGTLVRRIVERHAGTAVVARSITDAREALHSCQFDAALIDLLLLNGNGEQFIEELGETHPALPCILCTGVDTGVMGGHDRPGVTYLEKPVTQTELFVSLLDAMRNAPTQPSPPPTIEPGADGT